ncbi:LuxR C-terminal-related transcriptional regulator [Jatrophihabitans sp. YIM 134969]
MSSYGQPLTAVGIDDPVASDVYVTLVLEPGVAADIVAARTGHPPARVAAALQRLADADLVVHDGAGAWDAVSPDSSLASALVRREEGVREAKRALGVLEREFRAARRSAHPGDVVEILTGAEAVGTRLREAQRGANRSIRGLDRPPYVSVRPGSNRDLLAKVEEGLDVRIVLDGAAAAWPGRLTGEILEWRAAGDRVRIAEQLPTKVFLVDDEIALVPVVSTEASLQQSAYVVHPGSLLDALAALFEREWERASVLPSVEQSEVDDATAALLTLLAAGQTDAAIARAFEVSERTVQRRVQTLLARLGVTSRFQAGLRARERGWI